MAVTKQYAWFMEKNNEGGIIGNKSDLENFMHSGEEYPADDQWLEKLSIFELGQKYKVDVSKTYKLVEVK